MITLEHVSYLHPAKHFWQKPRQLIDDFSLNIPKERTFGLVGHNGSGKTTLLKIILGLIQPQKGQIFIDGFSPQQILSRRSVGFAPERPYFIEDQSAYEMIYNHAILADLPRQKAKQQTLKMLEIFNLSQWMHQKLKSYSKGMLQRACLAQALVHEPRILLLDEPTSGLDIQSRYEIKELLLQQKKEKRTLLLSSHTLSDIETLCDDVVFVDQGRLKKQHCLEDLKKGNGYRLIWTPCPSSNQTADLFVLEDKAHKITWTAQQAEVSLADLPTANQAIDSLRKQGHTILALQPSQTSLEALWLQQQKFRDP